MWRSIHWKAALWLGFFLLGGTALAVELRDGDVVFQRSASRQSEAIAAATKSDFTHVGVVFIEGGSPYVYEAVQPVRKIAFQTWKSRGKDGQVVVKRLRDPQPLQVEKLKKEVRAFVGKDYDWQFDWSDNRIYCSELVWKAYQRACGVQLGALRQLRDFDLSSEVVKRQLAERYGTNIPYAMKVVSPADLFNSPLLEEVPAKPAAVANP